MSTPQYGVRVIANVGPLLTLQVLSVSEDTPVAPDARDVDLFVRLLCDEEPLSENPRKGRKRQLALAERIDADGGDVFDEDWLWENAAHYIASVEQIERRNDGAPGRYTSWDAKQRSWKHEDQLAQAVFRVRLTDADFASHLEVGDGWDSCAYASEKWAGGGNYSEDELGGPSITIESVAVADARAYDIRGLTKRLKSLSASRTPSGADLVRAAQSLGASANVRAAVSNERTIDVVLADGTAVSAMFIVLDLAEGTLEDSWAAGNVDSMISIFGALDATLTFAQAIARISGPLLVHGNVPVVVEATSTLADLKSTLQL